MHMIKIHNFKRVNQNCKIATFDVELPNIGFIIHGMSLISSNGRQWVSYPQTCKEDSGKKIFIPHCKFTDSQKDKDFLKLVNEEISKLSQEPQASSQIDPPPF